MRKKLFLFCCLVLIVATAHADYRYVFSKEKNPLRELSVAASSLPLIGSKISWQNGVLKSADCHLVLYAPKEFSNGRVSLKARDRYESSVALIARANKNFSAFYALEVCPSQKKAFFYRFIYGEPVKRQEIPYGGGREFTLALDFDGKAVVAWINGRKVGEMPDDGRLKSGLAGIRGGFWTNAELKLLEYRAAIPGGDTPTAEQPLMKPVANIRKLNLKNILNWDLAKAYRSTNGTRHTVSLNQVWRFRPVADPQIPKTEPEAEWGYFVVPGYWAKGAISNFMRTEDGTAVKEWRGIPFTRGGASVWYRRTCNIPADWCNRKVELVIEDLCGAAEIYVGEQMVAQKRDPAIGVVRVDVSRALRYGENNELRIRNSGELNSQTGLGNVRFQLAPEVNFGEVGIVTSVSAKTLTLFFCESSVPSGSLIDIQVKDRNGGKLYQERRSFEKKIQCRWMPPVLWSPDTPELYFLELAIVTPDGKVPDRTVIRFGFREFTARDGQFFLNGKPIILKAETAIPNKGSWWGLDYLVDRRFLKPLFTAYKKLNLNCTVLNGPPSEEILSLADEMGLMLLVSGRTLSHAELDRNSESALKKLEDSLREMAKDPVYFRHPSQIGFRIDVWYGYNAGCTNPNYVGLKQGDPNQSGISALRNQRLNRMAALYRKYFPDQECFTGGSGAVGNIYGTHIYHTWGAPSTELRAFFEEWSRRREMPVFVGETYLPYIGSFFDLENFHGGGVPYITENAARVLGDAAYRYRTSLSPRPFHERGAAGWFWNTTENKAGGVYGFAVDAASAVTAEYLKEIMPGWRFHRLTGYGNFDYTEASFAMQRIAPDTLPVSRDYSDFSFKPEGFDNGNARSSCTDPRVPGYDLRPTLLQAPFAHAMADVSAAIFDGEEDPLLQNHSGYGGDTLKKSVILFNDSPRRVRYRLTVTLSDSQGRELPIDENNVEVAPYENKLVPVSVPLPATGDRSEWILRVMLTGKEKNFRLEFPIQVFARPVELKLASPLHVWDPEGRLVAWLQDRHPLKRLETLDRLPDSGILIVGRGALSKLRRMPDWTAAAEKGLNILFLEQQPGVSPELMKTRTRRTYINAPAHPAFEGLRDVDFSFWQGSFSLAPAKVSDGAGINWSDWGNRNMVASYAFRRPQHGSFISLLVSGFDLFQTPLLERRTGRGIWIASQLEITDRLGRDPVATRLFDNLLRYLDRPAHPAKVLFFGGKNGRKLIDRFQINCTEVNTLSDELLKPADLLIVADPDWEALKRYRMELNDFVYFGGRVLYWHAGESFDPGWLPFTMNLAEATAPRAAISGEADGVWRNGYGNSEFYWREKRNVPAFEKVPPHFNATTPAVLVRGRFGSGEWIFTTLSPSLFGSSAATGKTVRLLSALLCSCGVQISNTASPFVSIAESAKLDLSEQKWEFALDEKNIGIRDQWQVGKGEARWLKGLIADGIEVRVGQPFESFLRYDYNGCAWYRLTFDAPDNLLDAPQLYFSAGAIDDTDEVWLNGVKIGATGNDVPKYWEAMRNYPIPHGLLKKRDNLLVVRVFDEKGGGGMVKGPVMLSERKLEQTPRLWQTPWPEGAQHDYEYKADLVRMY